MLCFSIVIIISVNGRIIFAYFSEALLLYYLLENKIQINLKFIIIFLFSTVSSGTMSVILLVFFLSRKIIKNNLKTNKFIKILKIPIILIVLYFFIIFVKKNLIYYSGDMFALLQHGFFSKLYNISTEMYIFLILIFFFFLYITFLLKKVDKLLFRFYISSIIGLIFGFTAGSMVLPILLIYFLIIFNSKGKKLKKRGK